MATDLSTPVAGSDLYYSLLYTSVSKRRFVAALHAFHQEVVDVPYSCSDPGVAQVKLQWWREEIDRIVNGTPRHPLGEVLALATDEYKLPPALLLSIVDGTESALTRTHYENQSQVLAYSDSVTGSLWQLWARLNQSDNLETLSAARRLGSAMAQFDLCRNLRRDIDAGYVRLPRSLFEIFGVVEQDLLAHRPSDGLKRLLEQQLTAAYDHFSDGLVQLRSTERLRQLSLIIMAEISLAALAEVRTDANQLLHQRLTLTPLRRLWIAWRTSRRELKRARKE